MDDSEAEARAQRERLEAAEIYAFIFPVLDRLLLLDVRALPEHPPRALLVSSAEIVQDLVPRFRRQLSDLFLRKPELIFSRLRLFSYLDGEMAQLVVEAALAREQRPPVERGAERSFAYARVRTATAEFFGTPVWQLVEETAQRKSHNALGDSLAAAPVLGAPLPHHPSPGPARELTTWPGLTCRSGLARAARQPRKQACTLPASGSSA